LVTGRYEKGRDDVYSKRDMKAVVALLLLILAACGSATGPSSTPSPVSSPLGIYQLKFALIDSLGKPVYCDPDFYPLARSGAEQSGAISNYPAIRADAELFAAIVAHEHLPSVDLTDVEKLTLYRAWKLLGAIDLKARTGVYSFQYRVQSGAAYQMVSGTIALDGTIKVASRVATAPPVCPICLAAATLIATPAGPVRVTEIRPGMIVWTVDDSGARVAMAVSEIGSMPVPTGHLMVHLRLADGRDLLVSPGHPTADGRRAGALSVGDALDGSVITSWELVPYSEDRTYDLLPAGPTGDYWANGILLASTLKP
jgi:hypothetical protein